jgi:branched-chain amino acid transport system permease protein
MVLFKPEGIAGVWQAWRSRPRKVAPAAAARAGGAL